MLKNCAFDGLPGGFPLAAHPVDLSETPAGVFRSPPRLGQHTDEILHELGYDAGSIKALRADGVV